MSKKQGATGSPNVFKDLGVPRPEEHLVRAQLMFKIDGIMKSRCLKQAEAARAARYQRGRCFEDAGWRVPAVFGVAPAALF